MMSSFETAPGEQLAIVSNEDVFSIQDPEQLRDTRQFLLLAAQANLNMAYEITDVLVADGEEPKSRRKRVRVVG
jgi:hypothetical protein